MLEHRYDRTIETGTTENDYLASCFVRGLVAWPANVTCLRSRMHFHDHHARAHALPYSFDQSGAFRKCIFHALQDMIWTVIEEKLCPSEKMHPAAYFQAILRAQTTYLAFLPIA